MSGNETLRLQGVTYPELYTWPSSQNSKRQLAGNAICVSVLTEIVRNLLPDKYDYDDQVLPNDESAENYYGEQPKNGKQYSLKVDEPPNEGDYIEAKKHALWYGGLELIHTAASLTPTRLPFRLKSITTQRDHPTPEEAPTNKSVVESFCDKSGATK